MTAPTLTDAPPMNDADLRALCATIRGHSQQEWAIHYEHNYWMHSTILAIEALVAERDAMLKWKEDALLQCAKRQCAKRDARITELEQRNSELERGEILTDKDLLSSVITAVMSGKQSERDDACRKLQRHILAVEAERDARETECERWAKGNAEIAGILARLEPSAAEVERDALRAQLAAAERDAIAEVNRLLSLHVAEVERLRYALDMIRCHPIKHDPQAYVVVREIAEAALNKSSPHGNNGEVSVP